MMPSPHTVHGNTTNNVLSQVLRDLQHQLLAVLIGVQGIENGRQLLSIEFLEPIMSWYFFISITSPEITGGRLEENFLNTYHVNDGTDNLMDLSFQLVPSSSGHQAGAEGGFWNVENIVAEQRGGSEGSGPDSPTGDKSSKTAREQTNGWH